MHAISANHSDFAARAARVEKNSADARQLLWVGVDEVYSMPRRERKVRVSGFRSFISDILKPVWMVVAIALGAMAHCLGQVARFHVQGLPNLNANPDVDTMVQAILGIGIAMVFGYMFRLHSKSFTTLMLTGVVLGVLFLHNAVHIYPEFFANVTSAMWVDQVVSHTQPHSMLWRGASFVF